MVDIILGELGLDRKRKCTTREFCLRTVGGEREREMAPQYYSR